METRHEQPVEGSASSDELAAAERQRAARLLLAHPLVIDTAPDPEGFALVRRHGRFLKAWFSAQLGYRLVIEPDFARLVKRPAPGAAPRPAKTRAKEPFDGRRYSLLCLAVAALEKVEGQTVLSELASEVALLAASEAGIAPLDLNRHAERYALADAVRALTDLGVLVRADGDEAAFVAGSGDALYDVEARRLAQLIASPVPPSLAEGPEALAVEPYPDTEEGRSLDRRHRLMRRLLEEPVLYFEELDPEEMSYLSSQRHYLLRQIKEAVGLPVEVRREGLCVVDDGSEMSDLAFPAPGTVSHAALLFADFLTAGPGAAVPAPVPWSLLHAEATRLIGEYGGLWRKEFRDSASGAEDLSREALGLLAAMGLARLSPEGVLPLPAIARFKALEPEKRPEAADA